MTPSGDELRERLEERQDQFLRFHFPLFVRVMVAMRRSYKARVMLEILQGSSISGRSGKSPG